MRPLEGIKIVELADYTATPMAGRLMADWGATVYKIERAEGDGLRAIGVTFDMIDFTDEKFNQSIDANGGGNKTWISINPKHPDGLAILHRLLADADVFISSWRRKPLEKFGLDYDTLKEKYPLLIYGQVLGYGEHGRQKDWPGYDAICYSARGGVMRCLSPADGPPCNVPASFGDIQVGGLLCAGICGALLERARTGKGDYVTVSLYHAAIFANSVGVVSSTYHGKWPTSRMNAATPLNNTYPTKEGGWVLICLPNYEQNYNKAMRLIGREDLVDDPRYSKLSTVKAMGRNEEVIYILEDGFRTKTADEWAEIFEELDLPAGKCYTFEDILKDELAWENDYLRKVQYTEDVEKILPDTPVRFRNQGLPPMKTSDPIGYSTAEVLKQFGYTEKEIEGMDASGAIKCYHPK